MSIIYRDKSTNDRILIQVDDLRLIDDPDAWDITCVEVWNGDYMHCRELHIPGVILERHYRREEI